MNKKILLIALLLIGGLPFSCEQKPMLFTISKLGIQTGTISHIGNQTSIDSVSCCNPYPDTIPSGQLGVRLYIIEMNYVHNDDFRGPLINSAYADQPTPETQSSIKSILVTSNTDLRIDEKMITSGSDLGQYIKASTAYTIVKSLDEYLSYDRPWYSYDDLYLHFDQDLDVPTKLKLMVKITFEDQSQFDLTSEEVYLAAPN